MVIFLIFLLYKANKWSSADKPIELYNGLMNSHSLFSGWDYNRLVGLGNAISDGYLVVLVLKIASIFKLQVEEIFSLEEKDCHFFRIFNLGHQFKNSRQKHLKEYLYEKGNCRIQYDIRWELRPYCRVAR